MDSAFIYDKYVTGKNFVGRKKELRNLSNMLSGGENIVIYEPPKSGKMSAIQHTLFNLKMSGSRFSVCSVNLFNVRSTASFLTKFGSAVIRSMCSTPDEYAQAVSTFLDGTHFVFDRSRFADYDEVVSLNWDIDANDIFLMLRLPGRLAASKGEKLFLIVEEFQTLAELDMEDKLLRGFKEVLGERRIDGAGCTFIITGSRYNAMKAIFRDKPTFRGVIEHFVLPNPDEAEIAEYIIRGLLVTGKVIEKEPALGIARLFECNMWYVNHFMAICDSLTKGYITSAVLMDAMKTIISIHESRFENAMANLTWHQISFLQAVIEGITRFTAADTIRKYGLNSSANVVRVKEALVKKEILAFNEKDEPVILDPLFHHWLEKIYFV